MFDDSGGIIRKDLNIPDCYTTDPQAEVLVFERIPTYYFKKIFFFNEEVKANQIKRVPNINEQIFFVDKRPFSARSDYLFW
jgi:hypothetical protein